MDIGDMSDLRKFVAPEIVFGAGARCLAGRYAKNFGARKVLVVTDPGIIAAGWTGQVTEGFEDEGLDYAVFSDITPNPRAEQVTAGVEIYRIENCHAIVAVGGGSVMDCAKGIGIAGSNRQNVLDFEGVDRVSTPGPPLICIPTTAGTSADVSQFAIITDGRRKIKIAVISKTVVPDVALIDPVTTTSMDAYLTACTGLDALTHAIEAYASNAHSHFTDLHALEAIRLVAANLVPAIADPDNIELRNRMTLGSMYAGLAFSNASLGAVHAMAHSLGGLLDLAHGECNAILLSHVVSFNFDTIPERYGHIGQAMGLDIHDMSPDARKAAILFELNRLRTNAGVNRTLGQIGVSKRDIPELAENAMQDPCMVTNPRVPDRRDIEGIYEKAL
ncbi:MAG: iron-containing alcohol dehydrogenase [Eubacteriales bacterium]|nr:iron-containing alcohol dehydrogenase [Eubacteriales bacterium]